MESSVDSGTRNKEFFSLMEDKGALGQPKTPNIAVENDGRTISLQVLEFKTSLLEAVEELHIHRDAETRYEEQICKLVLEKQELEWQKFQAQIRKIEGEKGKNQLAAELKDKEIISLKEELKQLQEQKLQLQTQTKDSHLNQLGEVERRFAAVSRQCAMVKQAHEKLEQNDESIEFQKARKDGCSQNNSKELDIPMQADRTVPAVSLLVSTNDDNISRPEDVNPMTNHLSKSCDETKTGEPDDKGCPSNPIRSDTDGRLAELSGPETRSVYGVDGDPLALEPKDSPLERNLCTSEVTESQTSDKHMDSQGYATFQSKEDHQTAAPEFLQKETQTTAESLSEDKTPISNPQETVVFYDKMTITEDAQQGPCHDTIHEELEINLDASGATTPFETLPDESKNQFSPPELICEHTQSQVSQVRGLTETSLYRVINEMESKQSPLVDHTTLVEPVEVILENSDQKDDSEPLKSQQTELGVSSEEPKITNPEEDFSAVNHLRSGLLILPHIERREDNPSLPTTVKASC
ncbi:coiled-coil domain-containing 73 isoform X1 [Labeo rohita]|uniref:Coiled-coil domain-containing 73 isoform X1 n=1 Tax=Labeo rohita TaxID=84645 RepID=A0A498MLU4_LABRO|nr:coiled-coil domain-containing 73 isoform X1 [Labeo rohita]